MNRPERILVIVLRVAGVVTGSALFAVFLPTAWMAAIHEWLGLGKFPEGRIVEYLARSLSAFYAMHGGLCLFVSRDPRRYAGVITYLAVAGAIFGVLMLVIDLSIAMPLHWTLQEGPFVFALSFLILVLQSKAARGQRE